MPDPVTLRPNGAKRLLLTASAIVAIASPLAFGLLSSGQAVAQPKAKAAAPARGPAPAPARGSTATPADVAQRLAEQQAPRNAVAFDQTHFDKYVGYYELAPNNLFHVWRDGSTFMAQQTGQTQLTISPESETKFFSKTPPMQVSFNVDAAGKVSGLVFHSAGYESTFKKIDDKTAQALQATLAARIKNNGPADPAREAFLRRYFAGVAKGAPNYNELDPQLAMQTGSQLAAATTQVKAWGDLKSIELSTVGTPRGNDTYNVTFANANVRVFVSPPQLDGKVALLQISPLPAGAKFPPPPPRPAPVPADVAKRLADEAAPRQAVPFDPTHFDKFTGYYELSPVSMFKVYRDGTHLMSSYDGSQATESSPGSETLFFSKTLPAYGVYTVDKSGKAGSTFTLHEFGYETVYKRIDEATFNAITAAEAKRVVDGSPSPGTDVFLNKFLAAEEKGAPNYPDMNAHQADVIRGQQSSLAQKFKDWGPVVSVRHTGIDPLGSDIFQVAFKNATVEMRIPPPDYDGKVGGLQPGPIVGPATPSASASAPPVPAPKAK